jgi:ferric-dicitrate binding protein FerR (iron transport regulator)
MARQANAGCQRQWQAEAASDGRLTGKDLEAALRHRDHCTGCALEVRALAALTHSFTSLPELPRDSLSVRRCRQRLMAALNDSLLVQTPRRSRGWVAPVMVLAIATSAAILLFERARIAPAFAHSAPALAPQRPAVDVHAQAGARWRIDSDPNQDRVELSEGVATFDVHPHPGRRVIIVLPDGQLEDLGTTFEVAVNAGHTERIVVSRGRVLVRLGARPEFSLQIGERWQAPGVSASPPPRADVPRPVEPVKQASARLAPVRSTPAATHPEEAIVAPFADARPVPANPASVERAAKRAEDAAYMSILSLLRGQQFAAAREQAKRYLLDFPNGFRRVEVLNVATDGAAQ